MKLKSIILSFAVIVSAMTAANAQTAKKSTTAGIPQSEMTSTRCNLLMGNVKSSVVTSTQNGKTDTTSKTFNAKGQMISENSWQKVSYKYYTDKKYERNGTVVVVTYGKNKRVDTDDYGERFSISYQFNANGQLVQVSDNHEFMNNEYKYYYKTDKSKLPYKMEYSGGEGGEWWTITYEYQYLITDAHGNWTKRKVTETEVYESEGSNPSKSTKTYTETQKLTYF